MFIINQNYNLDRLIKLSDPICLYGGCYIPKRELSKIINIKKR